jgi:VIT1/CCC1 family predicted Fe2+/Mn2+ transporter
MHDPAPARAGAAPRPPALDPVSRASEVLFGLIMVLTFTASFGATGAGRDDVTVMLVGALGCALAWAIIDAALYLMGALGERALSATIVRRVRKAATPDAGRRALADALPAAVAAALSPASLDEVRLRIAGMAPDEIQPRLSRDDWRGAAGVFALVLTGTLPVIAPFVLFHDPVLAHRVSNAAAVVLLFLTGFAFGRQTGGPWKIGIAMVAIGLGLVAIAIVFGG